MGADTRAMARDGRQKLFEKSLDGNSAKPLTATVLTAPCWETQSYRSFRAGETRSQLNRPVIASKGTPA